MDKAIPKAIYGDIVGNYKKYANGQKLFFTHIVVEASKNIAEQFRNAGIYAEHADAKTSAVKRNEIMMNFKSGIIKVLCNVDLISEGFDVPDCTCDFSKTNRFTCFIHAASNAFNALST